jgi:phosphatidylinositol alpha-1,6-mannosyltransferase
MESATTTPPRSAMAGGDTPYVLIVARMDSGEQYKGHDQLLEAWPAVRREVPRAALVVAGSGDDAHRLQAKAVALGIGESVRFTGFVSDAALRELYSQAALFAMPSRNEGFGLVYLEAMSHGLPCIGSVHDAAGELIDEGTTGFLVDQTDTGALANRIIRLLTNAAVRTTMGAAGRRRLDQRFSYDRFRTRLLSALDEAFGGTESTAA